MLLHFEVCKNIRDLRTQSENSISKYLQIYQMNLLDALINKIILVLLKVNWEDNTF